ncbi:MAG: DNA gyrase subunit A [Parcubacteria group bacterium CG11_big_fil_rev_8_21_14_0_20_39_14]|nr:MAG: DNA gyrase subunit A [Parcubacteria group bacterium CG11_big_fil_rev_8_21_14_0_20_39_14]PIS35724.1 MAG: DNA gyrase subunit A [Parcubacteria group bacterium CG08_land_8_20_14_0_20_38_56]
MEFMQNIQKREITEEMKESYIDYAMSVIVSRALPDVRDGLKPVHRRILYAMHEDGLKHDAKFRKSAMIVGNTMSRYHPHGDIAIYDSLVRMAQDFSLRYPLVQGQGNFGSIDGDPPSAMRYSEARLSKIGEEILSDIDKNTVDFLDNYDETRKEPTVLPSKIPQLLLNGTVGIAVGMATNIPPHNLSELCDGLIFLVKNPKSTCFDLLQFIKGPDFPTGGFIYDQKAIVEAYSQGKGSIIIRGKAEIIEAQKLQLIISEIPFQVQKSALVENIANLVKEKKIDGIRAIRDESSREGIRIVMDLSSGAFPQKILNQLYKFTDLQKPFYLNILALVGGIQPQVLSLKDVLWHFIEHRRTVIKRRTEYDLLKSKERLHILEGLRKALLKIDLVIRIIKKSKTKEDAGINLLKEFKFSKAQAQAILQLPLSALAGLERKKIEEEYSKKVKEIKELNKLLKYPKLISNKIIEEFREIREEYGDQRKTKVFSQKVDEISGEDLIPQEEMLISLTQTGYIKRVNPNSYKIQKRGGKGIIGISQEREDFVTHFLSAMTHDILLFFSNQGNIFETKVYEIPEANRVSRGKSLFNFLGLRPDEKITAMVPLRKKESQKYLVMVTSCGIIKKTPQDSFKNIRKTGICAIKLRKNDLLAFAWLCNDGDEIILVSKFGQSIRFSQDSLRPMSRGTSGIKGMNIKEGDEIVGMGIIKNKQQGLELLVVSENGFGKRTKLKDYRIQKRGGLGIKTFKLTKKTGNLIWAKVLSQDEESLIAVSQKGQVIRVDLKNISLMRRVTQGVKIMTLGEGDKVVSATCV